MTSLHRSGQPSSKNQESGPDLSSCGACEGSQGLDRGCEGVCIVCSHRAAIKVACPRLLLTLPLKHYSVLLMDICKSAIRSGHEGCNARVVQLSNALLSPQVCPCLDIQA
eukprot:1140759-Pelagomonas_calceolata.AAC.8